MIDAARDLLAELQAAQARIEHLAQRALDDARAHDFLKRHGRWRQDSLDAIMAELSRYDAQHFRQLRASLNADSLEQDSSATLSSKQSTTRLTVSTLPNPNLVHDGDLVGIFDTEIPPPLTNPLELFIDDSEEEEKTPAIEKVETAQATIDAPKTDLGTPVQKTQILRPDLETTIESPHPEANPQIHSGDLPASTPGIETEPKSDIERLSDLIDNDPSLPSNWINRAKQRALEGDEVGAISDYLRAAHRTPNDPEIWHQLLKIYQRNGLDVKAAQAEEKLNEMGALQQS